MAAGNTRYIQKKILTFVRVHVRAVGNNDNLVVFALDKVRYVREKATPEEFSRRGVRHLRKQVRGAHYRLRSLALRFCSLCC